jgi:hypothetical protein
LLGPAEQPTAKEAMAAFFEGGEFAQGEAWEGPLGGFSAVTAAFSAILDDGSLMGLVAFVDYPGQVIALVAIGPQEQWTALADTVAKSFASFRKIADPFLAKIDPMRIRRVRLETSMSLAEYNASQPSSIPLPQLGLINHVDPNAKLPAERWIKRVVGFNPDPEARDAALSVTEPTEPTTEPTTPPAESPPVEEAPPPSAPPPT